MRSIQLRADGLPVSLRREHDPARGMIFRGQVATTNLDPTLPYLQLEFEVSQTLHPREVYPENLDPRQIGLLLNWLDVRPVDELTYATPTP
jgi:hypothetical protein